MRYLTREQIDSEISFLENSILKIFERRYGSDYRIKYPAQFVVDVVYGIAFIHVDEYYGKANVHKAANLALNKLGVEIS